MACTVVVKRVVPHSSAEVCVGGGAASTQLRKSVCGTCLLCPFRVLQRTVRWCALVAALGAGEVGPTARGWYTALGSGALATCESVRMQTAG